MARERQPAQPLPLRYRPATVDDVAAMERCREDDVAAGPADRRMAAYLEGRHHPGHALEPRAMFVALDDESVVAYVGGHRTTRYACDGELQYLYVSPDHRRRGVAAQLLRRLAGWFAEHGVSRVCVDVVPANAAARAFYRRCGATDLAEYWMVWERIESVVDGT